MLSQRYPGRIVHLGRVQEHGHSRKTEGTNATHHLVFDNPTTFSHEHEVNLVVGRAFDHGKAVDDGGVDRRGVGGAALDDDEVASHFAFVTCVRASNQHFAESALLRRCRRCTHRARVLYCNQYYSGVVRDMIVHLATKKQGGFNSLLSMFRNCKFLRTAQRRSLFLTLNLQISMWTNDTDGDCD